MFSFDIDLQQQKLRHVHANTTIRTVVFKLKYYPIKDWTNEKNPILSMSTKMLTTMHMQYKGKMNF